MTVYIDKPSNCDECLFSYTTECNDMGSKWETALCKLNFHKDVEHYFYNSKKEKVYACCGLKEENHIIYNKDMKRHGTSGFLIVGKE